MALLFVFDMLFIVSQGHLVALSFFSRSVCGLLQVWSASSKELKKNAGAIVAVVGEAAVYSNPHCSVYCPRGAE